MPEMGGLELLQSLRAEQNAVTLGFVTTEGTAEMRAKAVEAGAAFLIAKPFTADQFKSELGPHLS
jgi:two-component system chemotaxis response regulator CheY